MPTHIHYGCILPFLIIIYWLDAHDWVCMTFGQFSSIHVTVFAIINDCQKSLYLVIGAYLALWKK